MGVFSVMMELSSSGIYDLNLWVVADGGLTGSEVLLTGSLESKSSKS